MSFDAVLEFLAMGGHGLYVWLSYGVSTLVVLANVLSVRMARRRYFREAQALERRLAGTGGGAERVEPGSAG
jgi:heme exporter protein D